MNSWTSDFETKNTKVIWCIYKSLSEFQVAFIALTCKQKVFGSHQSGDNFIETFFSTNYWQFGNELVLAVATHIIHLNIVTIAYSSESEYLTSTNVIEKLVVFPSFALRKISVSEDCAQKVLSLWSDIRNGNKKIGVACLFV